MGDPRFRGVLLTGVGLTIARLVAFGVALSRFLVWIIGDDASLPWIGEVTWLNDLAGWGGVIFTFAASVVLMIPVASAITSRALRG